METKKRSREWLLWIVLVTVGLYPLSFGPAFWIASRLPVPPHTFGLLGAIYRPVIVAAIECPQIVQEPIAGYLGMGAPSDVSVFFFGGSSVGLATDHPGYTYTWLSYGNRLPTAKP